MKTIKKLSIFLLTLSLFIFIGIQYRRYLSLKVLGDEDGSFYISQEIDNQWELKYIQSYEVEYSTKEFSLDNTDNTVKIRINQKVVPFGDIEQIVLKACGEEIAPEYAKYVLSQESVLEDILYDDNNVIVNHENPIEIMWNMPQECNEDPILYLTANEYDSSPEDAFRFPNDERYFVRYDYQNNTSIAVDGVIDEVDGIQEPIFKPFWTPATGHPADYTYIYLNDDEQYVYFSLDLVIDNTEEYGLDWLKIIAVNTTTGDKKEYFVNDLLDTYGICSFGLTSKVDYKHQTCEVKIPKAEISENYLNFYLQYYGTASAYYVELSDITPSPGSTLNDSTPTITFNTNVNATCYISDTDYGYYDMEDSGDKCLGEDSTIQSCTVSYLGTNGSKNIHISCDSDQSGYAADSSASNEDLTYTLSDTTPPSKSNVLPSNLSQIIDPTQTIYLETDEPSNCRLSLTDQSYDEMSDDVNCIAADGVEHTCTTPDLGIFGQKNIYIACKDVYDNKDSSSNNTELTYTLRPITTIGDYILDFPEPNGKILAMALSQDESILYIGGEFTSIGGEARNYLAAIDTETYEITDWNPNPSGYVRTIETYGTDVYVGGSFSNIGETYTGDFAKISSSGTLDTNCMPYIRYESPAPVTVYSLKITDAYIYVGGHINKVGSNNIYNIVRLNNNSTCTWDDEWVPQISNGYVYAIDTFGTDIYVGGSFDTVNSTQTYQFAKIDSEGGLYTNCMPYIHKFIEADTVYSIKATDDYIYVGGDINKINYNTEDESTIYNIARLENSSTCPWDDSWLPQIDGNVHTIKSYSDDIYVGGGFEDIDEEFTGQYVRLTQNGDWDSTWDPEIYTPQLETVYSSVFGEDYLYVGGDFVSVNGEEVYRLAAFPLDKTGPVGSITINSDNLYTDNTEVSLSIIASDPASGVREMMVCNNSSFTGCSWETYSTTKSWTLSTGEGLKTVYIKFKDGAGNISGIYGDTITYHTLSIRITDINSLTDIPNETPLSYYVTSTDVTIEGITQANNIAYFVYNGNTHSTVANYLGEYSIDLDLDWGSNTIQYYAKDLSDNQSSTKTLYLTVHTPSVVITDIGLIRDVPNKSPMIFYFTSRTPTIQGITQANSTVYFEYDEETASVEGDNDGNFTITIDNPSLDLGRNDLTYYSEDSSGNQSTEKELTLIVGTENFPDWLLEKMGLKTPTVEETEEETEEEMEMEEKQEEGNGAETENENEEEDEDTDTNVSTKIKFVGENGEPLVRAVIEIEGETYVSDNNGEIYVDNLEEKKYEAKIRYEGKEYTAEILGAAGANIGTVIVEESQYNWNEIFKWVGVGASAVFIILIIIYSFRKRVPIEKDY